MDFYQITGISPDDLADELKDVVENYAASAGEMNAPKAYFLLNVLAFSGGNTNSNKRKLVIKANKLLRQCALDGDAELQCQLGNFLLDHKIAPQKGMTHADEAKIWLEKSLAQKHSRAAYLLSVFYGENRGSYKKDLRKAQEYIELAQSLGYTDKG